MRIFHTLTVLVLLATALGAEPPATVEVLRAPRQGRQPQAAVDSRGTVHMVYGVAEEGSPQGRGNLYYVTRKQGQETFSTPLRVNTHANTATLAGSTGGCQLALGKGDRPHIVWNGPHAGQDAPPQERHKAVLFYTRLNDEATAFVPEKNMAAGTEVLDGGSTVAADPRGGVHIFWHARGAQQGEAYRRVYRVSSSDEGRTFGQRDAVNPPDSGTCVCCSMRATADAEGGLYAAFRAAGQNTERDTLLLYSPRPGEPFKSLNLGQWVANYCPASSYGLAAGPGAVRVAWEQKGRVYFAAIDPRRSEPPATTPLSDPKAAAKYPAVATNSKGQSLVVWSEGVSFFSGGSLAWRLIDESNAPTALTGRVDGVPASGQATAYARPDGSFVIVY